MIMINVQVGWWKTNEGGNMNMDEYDSVQPVYMDVWRKEYVNTKIGAGTLGLVIADNDEVYI